MNNKHMNANIEKIGSISEYIGQDLTSEGEDSLASLSNKIPPYLIDTHINDRRKNSVILLCISPLLGIIILLCAIIEVPRRSSARGTIEAKSGSIRVYAHQSGVVQSILVKEGQRVSAGTPLIEVKSDGAIADGADVKQSLNSLLKEQSDEIHTEAKERQKELQTQLLTAQAKLRGINEQSRAIAHMISAKQADLSIARRRLAAISDLASKGYYAPLRLGEQEQQILRIEQDLEQSRVSLINSRSELSFAAREIEKISAVMRQSAATYRKQDAQIRMDRVVSSANSVHSLVSPVSASIAVLNARVGEFLTEGQTAMVLTDTNSPLEAEVWIPYNEIGYIQPGQPVSLMLSAFPYERYGFVQGTVREVATAPTLPREVVSGVRLEVPSYRTKIALSPIDKVPDRPVLVLGSEVTADIILERHTLFGWLFRPLIAGLRRYTNV